MTGPDLEAGRLAVEALMDDECVILRNADWHYDDEFDPDTGELAPPDPEWEELYAGPCKVRQVSERDRREGGADLSTATHIGAIPVGGEEDIHRGDVLRVTDSRRDPLLIGREFTVRTIYYGTFTIQRRFGLETVLP